MQQAEVQSSLIAKINEAHTACVMCSENMRDAVLLACNRARECGQWLRQLKESNKGRFQSMFANRGAESDTRFTFTYETANRYINFADRNPDEIKQLDDGISSLRKAMEAAGALSAKTHEGQTSHTGEQNFFIAAGKQLMAFSALWDKQAKLHPVDKWTPETAETFVIQLEPTVVRINTIYAEAKKRSLSHAEAA